MSNPRLSQFEEDDGNRSTDRRAFLQRATALVAGTAAVSLLKAQSQQPATFSCRLLRLGLQKAYRCGASNQGGCSLEKSAPVGAAIPIVFLKLREPRIGHGSGPLFAPHSSTGGNVNEKRGPLRLV